VLTRELAHAGHYPAVDVLQSVSRLEREIAAPDVLEGATRLRALMAAYRDKRDLIAIGAYERGSDPLVDRALELKPAIDAFLRQAVDAPSTPEEAGRTSGASFPAIFRRILLPLIAPMFGSVFLLTFVAAFRDISATILLAGPSSRTMAILMIELGEEGRFEAMAVVGVILSLVVLAMTAAMRRLQARVSLLA